MGIATPLRNAMAVAGAVTADATPSIVTAGGMIAGSFERLAKQSAPGFEAFFQHLPAMVGAAGGAAEQVAGQFGALAGGALAEGVPAFGRLADAAGGFGAQLMKIGAANLAPAMDGMTSMTNTASGMAAQLAPAIGPSMGAVTDLANSAMGAFGSLSPEIASFAGTVSQNAPGLQGAMQSIGSGALTMGGSFVAGVAQAAPAFAEMSQSLKDNQPALTSAVAGTASAIAATVGAGAGALGFLTDAGNKAGDFIQKGPFGGKGGIGSTSSGMGGIPGLGSGTKAVDRAVQRTQVSTSGGKFLPAGSMGSAAPPRPARGGGGGVDRMASAGPGWGQALTGRISPGGVPGGGGGLGGAAGGGPGAGAGAAARDMKSLKSAADGARASVRGLGPQVASSMNSASGATGAAAQGMRSSFQGATSGMSQAAQGVRSSVPQALSAGMGGAQKAVAGGGLAPTMAGQTAQVVRTIQQAAPAAAAGGASMGAAAAGGAAAGVTVNQTRVLTIVRSWVTKIVDVGMSALGARSPSRKFMQLGQYASQGMAAGIGRDGGHAIDAVTGMIGHMQSAANRPKAVAVKIHKGAGQVSRGKDAPSPDDGPRGDAKRTAMGDVGSRTRMVFDGGSMSNVMDPSGQIRSQLSPEQQSAMESAQSALDAGGSSMGRAPRARLEQMQRDIRDGKKGANEAGRSVGSAVMEGQANGVASGGQVVIDRTNEWAFRHQEELKRRQGVRSPSTVFAAIGSDLMAGMAVGVTAGAPAAAAAGVTSMDSMTDAAMTRTDRGLQLGHTWGENVVTGAEQILRKASYRALGMPRLDSMLAKTALGQMGLLNAAGSGASTWKVIENMPAMVVLPAASAASGGGSVTHEHHIYIDGDKVRTIAVEEDERLLDQLAASMSRQRS